MSWGAVIGAAATVVGGYMSNKSAKNAAKAQQQGGDAAIAEQRRQYDQTREDQMPWLDAGKSALAKQNALLGGNYSGFYQSPEYAWTQQQGLRSLDRSAAARGGLYSGGADADRMKFAQGLASQEYGNYWNRLAGVAGTGQSVGSSLGQLGASMATNIGNQYNNMANARASSYLTQGNNNAQMVGAVAGAANNYYQRKSANNGGGMGWYLGSNPGRG